MAVDLSTSGLGGTCFDAAHVGPGLLTAHNAQRSGTATISAASANVTITAATIDPSGATYAGKPAFAIVMQTAADGTLTQVVRTHWSGNDLVIEGNASATANTTVAWFVDGRA